VVPAIAELSQTITRFHQNDDNIVQAMRTLRTFTQKFQPELCVGLRVPLVFSIRGLKVRLFVRHNEDNLRLKRWTTCDNRRFEPFETDVVACCPAF
jgi:hypothetical protein